jgi:two-component system OmpR family sensor kinase
VDFSALTPTRLDAAALAATALERQHLPADRLHVEAEDRHVEADATLLLRAISNLIDNAERHGKGLVRLSLRSRPGYLVLEAEDAGPGFTEAEMARAFEPFQRRGAGDDDGRSCAASPRRITAPPTSGRARRVARWWVSSCPRFARVDSSGAELK